MVKMVFFLALTFVCLEAITLKELVNKSIENDSEIINQELEYNRYKSQYEQSKSSFYPKVDLEVSSGIQGRKRITDKNGFEYDDTMASITLNQNIFNGFYDVNKKNSFDKYSQARYYKLIELKNEKTYDILEKIINYKIIYEKSKLHKELIDEYSEFLNDAREMYQAGQMLASDFNDIKSQIAMARIRYYNDLKLYKQYKTMIHKHFGRIIEADEIVLESEQNLIIPDNLYPYIKETLKDHATIKTERLNIDGARYDYQSSKSNFYPKLSLEASANKYIDSGIKETDPTQIDESYSIKLVVRWNLFNGMYDKEEKAKKFIEYQKAQTVILKVKEDIIEELQLAFDNLLIVKEQFPHITQYNELIQKKLVDSKIEYEVGRKALIDVVPILSQSKDSQKEVIQNKMDTLLAEFRILKAMGIIYEYFGEQSFNVIPDEYISKDTDLDGIIDVEDICFNSENNSTVGESGCLIKNKEARIYFEKMNVVETDQMTRELLDDLEDGNIIEKVDENYIDIKEINIQNYDGYNINIPKVDIQNEIELEGVE